MNKLIPVLPALLRALLIGAVLAITLQAGWLLINDFSWPSDACDFVQDGTGMIVTRDNGTCDLDLGALTLDFVLRTLFYTFVVLQVYALSKGACWLMSRAKRVVGAQAA